ncbi:MAG: bacterial Ig-like domain-containing protein [Agathobacter sp.]|nr:bacterial Ig-like domain-containing protein [Agathobacter sp.]
MTKKISKQLQRWFALLLVAVMMFATIPMNANVVTGVGVNEEGYIEIRSIEDLYNIRDDLTANYILMNDIDLTEATADGGDWNYGGRGWNPIGSNDTYSNLVYSGNFEGNGHSIIGMRIENSKSGYLGLFANVTGRISNLNMVNVSIVGGAYAGAIAANADGAIFENCTVSGVINGTKTAVGGIVGTASNITISNSKNTADIVGGAYVGGIIGKANYVTVDKTFNTGMIRAENNIGYYEKMSGTSLNGYSVYRYSSAASIIGDAENSIITNCYNVGKVSAIENYDYSNYYYYAFAYGISSGGAEAITCYNSGQAEYAIGSSATDCYYLDGSGSSSIGATSLTEAQMKIESMYKGFDFENVWVLNTYANYPYPQLRSNIQDISESAELVSIIALPTKTDYFTGDKIDFSGAIVKVVYVSGREEIIDITNDIVSGFDLDVVGEQQVTVTVAGASDTYTINVKERPVVSAVSIVLEPDQKVFAVGTTFDFTGAKAKISYVGGITEYKDIEVEATTGGNINHIGKQMITYTFGGKSATFEIEVLGVSLEKIVLTKLPSKLSYAEGHDLDLSGMVVTAVMNNGLESTIGEGYTVSGYSSEPGTHTITVTYQGKTASFDITVEERKLVSLTLNSLPDKLEYIVGQEFDETGMQVIATYDNGDVVVAEDYTVSGFDDIPGIKTIVVSLDGQSVSFPAKVKARVITDFELVSAPSKLDYIEYEAFDSTGLKVEATYNDGITEVITDYTLTGFSSKPGTHTVTITYEGFVKSFDINVIPRVLEDIRIIVPDKLAYFIGEEFDATGMEVIACYNNGQEISVDDYKISGFDSTASGTKTITIIYGGIERSFVVMVEERSVVEANGSFIVNDLVGRLGEEVHLPVNVTCNTAIAGFRHEISFESSNLKFVGLEMKGDYSDGTLIINEEKASEGKITVLWFSDKDVKSKGLVYELVFQVQETAVDGVAEVKINFNDNDHGNLSGENVIFGRQDGSVEVRSYWLGDLNGDRKYAMVDLVMLAQYVADFDMTLTEKQMLSADVNEDGSIDIHDVIMLNQWLLDEDF